MSKIIAFTGKKGTGKSTCCAYLEEKYGFTRVNFKDALIAELKQNFPDLLSTVQDFYTELPYQQKPTLQSLFDNKPPLIRTLMQNYGTNVRRKDKDSYWVEQWQISVQQKRGLYETKGITIDDCRFLNEAKAIKDNGGIIIRLIRTDMEHTDTHISETEMDSIVPDFAIVCNGGDYEHLHRELDAIMAK
jgi:hypothetical protein